MKVFAVLGVIEDNSKIFFFFTIFFQTDFFFFLTIFFKQNLRNDQC